MSENKVNPSPGYSITDRKLGSAGEGLRILARLIARHLLTEKLGMDGQHPSGCSTPCMPDALVKEEAGR